jgi:hypothetical protein
MLVVVPSAVLQLAAVQKGSNLQEEQILDLLVEGRRRDFAE